MDHPTQLEEIDKEQRQRENIAAADNLSDSQSQAFAKPMVEALNPHLDNPTTPLLPQEEIEDQEPPRVNLTAVVCTAIVAVCATSTLLVAQPWNNGNDLRSLSPIEESVVADTAVQQSAATAPSQKGMTEGRGVVAPDATQKQQPAETQKPAVEPQKETPEPKSDDKKEIVKPKASSLPVVQTTKTGTSNVYNNIRLIDASSRLLTKSEVEQMTKEELALARNSIYARHGYQFNNPDLKEFFAKQSWFKPSDVKIDAIPFTQTELDNIRLIKAQEQK